MKYFKLLQLSSTFLPFDEISLTDSLTEYKQRLLWPRGDNMGQSEGQNTWLINTAWTSLQIYFHNLLASLPNSTANTVPNASRAHNNPHSMQNPAALLSTKVSRPWHTTFFNKTHSNWQHMLAFYRQDSTVNSINPFFPYTIYSVSTDRKVHISLYTKCITPIYTTCTNFKSSTYHIIKPSFDWPDTYHCARSGTRI